MALPGAIVAQLRDSITVQLAGAVDAYGQRAAGSSLSVRGRVVTARTMVQSPGGDRLVEATKVIIPDVSGFTADAQLTLPDGTTHGVRSFSRRPWPDGRTYHIEVLL
jgi:hypothetical protein